MSNQVLPTNKAFGILTTLFNAERVKEKQPKITPTQSNNLVLSTLTQIICHTSFKQAQHLLSEIGQYTYSLIQWISEQTDPIGMMKAFLMNNRKNRGKSLFRTTHKTQNETFDTIRPVIADRILQEQQTFMRRNLKKKALQNQTISIAIDPTVKEYTGIKPNHCQPVGYIGQKEMYGKAFSEVGIYDTTSQFIIQTQPKYATGSHYKRKAPPDWLSLIAKEVIKAESQNINVKAIYGDREYYQGIGFAWATLGKFSPSKDPTHNPRFCIPKKMRDGISKKWEFLLDSSRKDIEIDKIELGHYDKGLIKTTLHYFASNSKGTRHLVPFYSIATFDAYSNRKRKQSLSWARKKAQKIEQNLLKLESELELAERHYIKFRLKYYSKDNAKKLNYKGKHRKRFKIDEERSHYETCRGLYAQLKNLRKKKQNLCKRLMFFCVNCRLDETIDSAKDEVMQVATGYHQRWGIESAFQSIKDKFWIPCKKRSVQARHIRFIISSLLYNSWHYYRLIKSLKSSRYKPQTIRKAKIWHKNVNRKILAKITQTLSAGEFLTQSWGSGLMTCLKAKFC